MEGVHWQTIACRLGMRGNIADYCTVAGQHLALGGLFACVFPVAPPGQHERLQQSAAAAGLSIIRWRPVVFREGEPPLIGLFAMMAAKDLPDAVRSQTWT